MAVKKRENKKEDLTKDVVEEKTNTSIEGDVFSEDVVYDSPEYDAPNYDTVEEPENEETFTEAEVEPSMPMSAVEGMIKRMEERLTNQFNSRLQKLKLGKAKEELDADAQYVSDLEDDWLEVPVVFFAYSINFSIHGDKKRGKSTVPPQGAVRFKPIIRSKRQGKRGLDEVVSVSSIKVHSKEVVNYLRNHSQFGIAFFENMDSVLKIDSGWANRLIEANQAIQGLSDQQVISRCRQEGLPIGTDVPKMRKNLVELFAKQAESRQHKVQYGKLENAIIDSNNAQGSQRQIIEKTIQG